MGDFIGVEERAFRVNSLNWLFGNGNIDNTFAVVEELRTVFPNLLNPLKYPGPKAARKQTLRFAAFLLTDEVAFDGSLYPSPNFKNWLKWLTWLGTVQGGTLTKDGKSYGGSASDLVLEILSRALPPGGPPSPVHFAWVTEKDEKKFAVEATTSPGFKIKITSVDHSGAKGNGDDEDGV